jgi:hypothetical protein
MFFFQEEEERERERERERGEEETNSTCPSPDLLERYNHNQHDDESSPLSLHLHPSPLPLSQSHDESILTLSQLDLLKTGYNFSQAKGNCSSTLLSSPSFSMNSSSLSFLRISKESKKVNRQNVKKVTEVKELQRKLNQLLTYHPSRRTPRDIETYFKRNELFLICKNLGLKNCQQMNKSFELTG